MNVSTVPPSEMTAWPMCTSSVARSPMQWQPRSFLVLRSKTSLTIAVLVADDLAARVVPVERAPDDRVAPLGLRVLLGEADAAHLGDRVDAEREERDTWRL